MQSRLAPIRSACLLVSAAACLPAAAAKFQVLDFFGVGGYAHTSRATANTYLDSMATAMDFGLTKTEDPTVFTAENLAKYKVVILNSCTEMGKILNTDQRTALLNFIRTKGVIAWHASGDQKGSWPEYTTFMGGELSSHGAGIATIRREKDSKGSAIAATDFANADTARFDEEWYAYKTNPRETAGIRVVYTMDEVSCANKCSPVMGDHPIVWTREEPTGGRFFYSGMGHFDHIFQKTAMTKSLYGQAMAWAAGAGTAPIRPLADKSFDAGVTAWLLGGDLEVSVSGNGPYRLGLRAADGRLFADRPVQGPGRYRFESSGAPRPLILTTTGAAGSEAQLIR